MAWTREWQTGFETQSFEGLDDAGFSSNNAPVIGSSKSFTGGYSLAGAYNSNAMGRNFQHDPTQVRFGFYINHNSLFGFTSSYIAIIGALVADVDNKVQYFRWNGGTGDIELRLDGVDVTAIAATTADFTTIDRWYHIGIVANCNGGSGFMSLYIDGVQVLTYTGNVGTYFTGAYVGGSAGSSGQGWKNYYYIDNLYIDTASGAEADVAPPSPIFKFLPITGDGDVTQWTPSNADDNYENVDDTTADGDGTYNYAESSGLQDSYAITDTTPDVTIEPGQAIAAVIPYVQARRTDTSVDSTIKVGTRLSATNELSAEKVLNVAYNTVMDRQVTKPGGGLWTESDLDAMQIIVESSGDYS
jgi:hypothetical protein